LTLNIKV